MQEESKQTTEKSGQNTALKLILTYSQLCFAVPVGFCFTSCFAKPFCLFLCPLYAIFALYYQSFVQKSLITIGISDDEVPTTQKVAVHILRFHAQFAATGTLLQYIADCMSWWSCSFGPPVSWLSAHWVLSSGYSLSFIVLCIFMCIVFNKTMDNLKALNT